VERVRIELWPTATSRERSIVLWRIKVIKRIGLSVLVLALIVVEIFLCGALLPAAWQTAIVRALSHISSTAFDYSVVTHPALGYEIDDMLRRNMALRLALDAVALLLLVGNAFLVTRVWRFLRLTSRHRDDDPQTGL
jgi:hypothetical protein